MNKRLIVITAGIAYETFTAGALAACPLPRDEVSATCLKECRDEQHIEQEIALSTASTAVSTTVMISAGLIAPMPPGVHSNLVGQITAQTNLDDHAAAQAAIQSSQIFRNAALLDDAPKATTT